MTHEDIKNIIVEKALSHGVPQQYSDIYDQLDYNFKVEFEEIIFLRNFGLPILQFRHPSGKWVIIGTCELAWFDLHVVKFINICEIKALNIPQSEKERVAKIQPIRGMWKMEYEQLDIESMNGRIYSLHVNKWREYFVFWNIMLKIFNLKNHNPYRGTPCNPSSPEND